MLKKLQLLILTFAIGSFAIVNSLSASVVLDDFSLTDPSGGGVVYSNGGFSVTRSVTGGITMVGGLISSPGDFSVTYSAAGGTFDSLYVADPSALGSSITDFTIGMIQLPDADYVMTVNYSGGGSDGTFGLVDGTNNFQVDTNLFGSATSVTFDFVNNGPGGLNPGQLLFGSGNLVATPEPTSVLMFGSILGLGLFRRRRRS